ncbi:MAG: terminase large subunit [Mycobacteriaceae bacterium]|nr:terminase large subunit [Mycobacteriaceae bacterium]
MRRDRNAVERFYAQVANASERGAALLRRNPASSTRKPKTSLEGMKHDPTVYPVFYGADLDDDWTDEKVWRKANPSLGVTVPIEKVRVACEQAKQNPIEENTFRQLRLNQWVKQSVRWMLMHVWNQNVGPVNLSDLEGRPCYGGLDLAPYHLHHFVRARLPTRTR